MTPTLQYPSIQDPGQIAVERDAYHFRLIVPPVPSLRRLPRSYLYSLLVLLVLVIDHLCILFAAAHREVVQVLPGFAMDAVGFVALFYFAYLRLHCWTTFEITARHFRVLTRAFSKDSAAAHIARSDLLEIRLNRYNGKLILRAQRREMREFFISTDRQMVQQIVDKLREALEFSFEPVPGVAPPLPVRAPSTLIQRKRASTAATVAAVGLIIGVAIWPTAGTILLIVAALAAIPLGIIFGTQEKDFYP